MAISHTRHTLYAHTTAPPTAAECTIEAEATASIGTAARMTRARVEACISTMCVWVCACVCQ